MIIQLLKKTTSDLRYYNNSLEIIRTSSHNILRSFLNILNNSIQKDF